jgi:hypothetical protein
MRGKVSRKMEKDLHWRVCWDKSTKSVRLAMARDEKRSTGEVVESNERGGGGREEKRMSGGSWKKKVEENKPEAA